MERRDLRQKMLEIRKSLTSTMVNKASKQICEVVKDLDSFKSAERVASYVGCNGEVKPSFLESNDSKIFSLPVAQEDGLLKFVKPDGELKKGRFGIPEPKTGVEIEALIASAIASLTIYDMCKSVDKSIKITDIQLDKKTGGKSGIYIRK